MNYPSIKKSKESLKKFGSLEEESFHFWQNSFFFNEELITYYFLLKILKLRETVFASVF